MVIKNYKHAITGKVAKIDDSVANNPILGRNLIEVECDDTKCVIEIEEPSVVENTKSATPKRKKTKE
jgi:hypothetical protein